MSPALAGEFFTTSTTWEVVFSLSSLTDRMRPIHFMEGNLLYSKCTDLNVCLIQEIPSQQHPHMFDQTSGYQDLDKLTRKINHHTVSVLYIISLLMASLVVQMVKNLLAMQEK